MNNNSINDEMIALYILGDLSDEQAERLDELAIADAEFFERVGSIENDIVDRYVNGDLSEAESGRFESHYLISPLRREKVKLARAFQDFAAKTLSAEGLAFDSSKAGATSKIAGFFSSLGIFGGAQPAFRFAMAAAAFVIVAFGGWLILRNLNGGLKGNEVVSNISVNRIEPVVQPSPRTEVVEVPANENQRPGPTPVPTPTPKPPTPQQSKPLIASFVLSPPLRGTNMPSLSIPAATDRAVVRLELESGDFKAYTAELKEVGGGRVVWRSGRLSTARTGGVRSVNLSIPAKSLKSAIYSITVTGLSTAGEPEIIGDYPFRVVR